MAVKKRAVKVLPSMDLCTKFTSSLEEFNTVSKAFGALFSSKTLTKMDYVRIFEIFYEKLPVLKLNKNMVQYTHIVVEYVQNGYPKNPDFEKLIPECLSLLTHYSYDTVAGCVCAIREKLPECSTFVGAEVVKGRHFGYTLATERDYQVLRSLV